MSQADVAIIGGGIVGLATAVRLLEARPGLRIEIVEKDISGQWMMQAMQMQQRRSNLAFRTSFDELFKFL